MPRNGSGTYTLPQPAFVAGTTISSSAVNSDLNDIASALTGSLPRDGQAGMTGPLKLPDGSTLAPALTFSNEDDSGLTRPASGQIGVVIGNTLIGYFNASGWQGPSGSGVPVGSVTDYAGSSAPTGWILCYGQNVPRASYPLLFAAIGTTYGAGDGATTFGLPDLRGRAIYGKDNMGGSAASRLTTTYFGTDPTVLAAVGGSQSSSLSTTHLPPYTPSGTNSSISVSGSFNGFIVSNTFQTGTAVNPCVYGTNGTIPISATGPAPTFTGVAQGGLSTGFTNVSPGMVMNKIIYAGA